MSTVSKEVKRTSKKTAKCQQLTAQEKQKLFELYIVPNLTDIKSLTRYYTDNYQDVEDNYNMILAQLYHYIGSYNPKQKLETWLHIVVKLRPECHSRSSRPCRDPE